MTSEVNFGLWPLLAGLIEDFSKSTLTIHEFSISNQFQSLGSYSSFGVRQVFHHQRSPLRKIPYSTQNLLQSRFQYEGCKMMDFCYFSKAMGWGCYIKCISHVIMCNMSLLVLYGKIQYLAVPHVKLCPQSTVVSVTDDGPHLLINYPIN